MKYDFETAVDRRKTNSAKWSDEHLLDQYGETGLISSNIADMDFRVAPEIVDAVRERADFENYGYCFPDKAFLEACAGWQKRRNGWDISTDWIVYMPGVNAGIIAAVRAFTSPGDRVIMQTPVYSPYHTHISSCGRVPALNSLINNDGWYEIDFADLEEKAKDPKTTALLLCSPHNPVGRAWKGEELEKIGRICIDNGLTVISDEIHSDLVYAPAKHIPFAAISDEFARHSIICTAPTKTFNLAGLFVSDMIIPDDDMRKRYREITDPYYFWPGCFGSAAQTAAYSEGEAWLEELLAVLKSNAEYIADFLSRRLPGVRYRIPEATYLAWLDFRDYGLSNAELHDLMIHKAKVAPDDGPTFSAAGDGDGFQRLNFACPRSLLDEALTRIAGAFETL
ncbi:MAG: MalY/PatB family protein [Anaerovoracaceae bacterium]|nr:MalY/PatB family protein [Anaerovoracaceae bacterium]